jgi:hypothetical protein
MSKLTLRVVISTVALILLPGLVIADGKISFRLNGGWTHILSGDANHGTKAFFDYHSTGWDEQVGRYRALHNGYEFGGDIIYEISPRVGIGIGGGYLEISQLSHINFHLATGSLSSAIALAKPKLSAIPIRAGVFLTVPLKRKFNFLVNAGLSYFLRSRYSDETEAYYLAGDLIWPYIITTTRAECKRAPIGFQGGISLEYEMGRNIIPFLEARVRYARFRGWKGTSVLESDYWIPLSEQGTLYYEVVPTMINTPRLLMVQESPPNGPGGEPRQAAIDFSGISLQVGIRIRL